MDKRKIVAIHQPAFFPWLGFFDKIVRSDIFVLLDSVQFQKTGGYWVNRVRIIINGNEHWLTVPIIRAYSGVRLITEMEINNTTPWREKMIKSIEINYKKAPYFESVFGMIRDMISTPGSSICEYDIAIMNHLCSILGIDVTKVIRSSTLSHEGNATDLLISIVKLVSGDTYMCGGGASKYQEDEKFGHAGINLLYQEYQHPVYPQFNSTSFMPGLSILDSLMNCGVDDVKNLLKVS